MKEADKSAFEPLIEKIVAHLLESGIHVYLGEFETLQPLDYQYTDVSGFGFQVAVQFDQAPEYSGINSMINPTLTSSYDNHPDATAYFYYVANNVYWPSSTEAYFQNEGIGLADFGTGAGCYHCSE